MNKTELLTLLAQGEGIQLECKLARGQDNQGELPKDFWKTYSAMANTHGGIVLLGVEEIQQHFTIVGVENINKVKKNLFDLVNNKNHVSYNLLNDENVSVYRADNKNILLIKIPQATRKQKPIYLTKNPIGNTYLRLHEADVLCDEDIVKRMLAEQLNDSFDHEILSEHYSFANDIALHTLQAYRNRLSAHKPDHPFLDLDLFEFFKKK